MSNTNPRRLTVTAGTMVCQTTIYLDHIIIIFRETRRRPRPATQSDQPSESRSMPRKPHLRQILRPYSSARIRTPEYIAETSPSRSRTAELMTMFGLSILRPSSTAIKRISYKKKLDPSLLMRLPIELVLMIVAKLEAMIMKVLADSLIDELLQGAFYQDRPWWNMTSLEIQRRRGSAPLKLSGRRGVLIQPLPWSYQEVPLASTVDLLFRNSRMMKVVFETCFERATRSSCNAIERQKYIDIRLWLDRVLIKLGRKGLYNMDDPNTFIS